MTCKMALIGETDMVGNFAVVSAHTGRTNSTKRKVEEWLNLEEAASVEVSSEDPQHPIESVFKHGESLGWRADESGAQKIRLLFDETKDLRRIWLRFSEPQVERTQQLTLSWAHSQTAPFREIVRQQWKFNPRT